MVVTMMNYISVILASTLVLYDNMFQIWSLDFRSHRVYATISQMWRVHFGVVLWPRFIVFKLLTSDGFMVPCVPDASCGLPTANCCGNLRRRTSELSWCLSYFIPSPRDAQFSVKKFDPLKKWLRTQFDTRLECVLESWGPIWFPLHFECVPEPHIVALRCVM